MIGKVSKNRSFGKDARLRGRSRFIAVHKGDENRKLGRRTGGPCRIISVESAETSTKFGIIVSRKAGGAVRRNRLKRIIREFLRNNKSYWPDNRWIVIRIDAPVENEDSLIAEIKRFLRIPRMGDEMPGKTQDE